jgi:hypothetical protein
LGVLQFSHLREISAIEISVEKMNGLRKRNVSLLDSQTGSPAMLLPRSMMQSFTAEHLYFLFQLAFSSLAANLFLLLLVSESYAQIIDFPHKHA